MIDKKSFIKTTLDKNIKVFIIHIIFFYLDSILIYQTWKAKIALLLIKKVLVLAKNLDFTNIFFSIISYKAI